MGTILEAAMGAQHAETIDTIGRLAHIYDAWHAAEPEAGHDAKAAQWRARLASASEEQTASEER